jgi:hypothetical protein
MKNPLKIRWIILGFIWATALLLTYGNQTMIQNINEERERFELRHITAAFVQKNRHQINAILNNMNTYRQPVESIQIGCLALKTQLRSLAAAHNLMVLALGSDTEQAGSGTVPIHLSFVGTYTDALEWLAALERDCAYAPAVKVKVQQTPDQLIPQFEIRIQYQFKLAEPKSAE